MDISQNMTEAKTALVKILSLQGLYRPIHPTDGALKPVLKKFWILCNDIIMTMAGTYSMSITHICLVLSHLSLLCYITSSVPLPNLSLTFVTLYLESYCASRILHLFLSNILLLPCTVPSSSYLSGESVRIISLHGAVAGTAAPRAHTALRASNLRLKTSNFTLFHQQR